jgi:DNA-binding transcriptional ArsR family regulator
MKEQPQAVELLKAAREAVSAEILPALPEALRYTGLMVANAIAIAEREIVAGDGAERAECERLRSLFSERPEPIATDALLEVVARYNRRLAAEIRTGRFDGEERRALLEHLRRTTEEKLAISNPKALQGR